MNNETRLTHKIKTVVKAINISINSHVPLINDFNTILNPQKE